jgi:hypothetical protein
MIKWGWIVNKKLKKLFFTLSKDYLYRNKTISLTFHSHSTPICHLPAALRKMVISQNGVVRSTDVPLNWLLQILFMTSYVVWLHISLFWLFFFQLDLGLHLIVNPSDDQMLIQYRSSCVTPSKTALFNFEIFGPYLHLSSTGSQMYSILKVKKR